MKHSNGVYIFADGAQYVGQWKNDQITGEGSYTFSDGSICKGSFVNGKINGQGTFDYINGDQYNGAFKNGSDCSIRKYWNVIRASSTF